MAQPVGVHKQHNRFAVAASRIGRSEAASQTLPPSPPPPFDVFKRVPFPERDQKRDPRVWVAMLEAGLPPHLRHKTSSASVTTLDAADCAEILLAAQDGVRSEVGVDILYELGIVEGRWRAAVWLVKHLVENFATRKPKVDRLTQTIWPWNIEGSLQDLCLQPVDLQKPERAETASLGPILAPTLDELTDDLKPENMGRTEKLRRAILGQVWRSLGAMIITCTDGVVKAEILEIIAYLHHSEIMPASIYSQKPGLDETTIQQPPTLHLLSSRILTSLSDAAWRAHERVVVEEVHAKGGEYVALRPEIPGMAYRVNVAGLRPEIWLELVLWACLHGGWILEGAAVLRSVYRQKPQWKPLSWRSLLPAETRSSPNWDKLDYLFNSRSSATMDPPAGPIPDVKNTVSSEIVNAYVDAILSTVNVGVGERGAPLNYVLAQLNMFKNFLERSGARLTGAVWDAVLLRFVDLRANSAFRPHNLTGLGGLTSRFEHDVDSNRSRNSLQDTLYGSAFFLGLCHRVLRSEIVAGNLEGALRAFKALQDYTDSNKRQALEQFFASIRNAQTSDQASSENDLFTSNYSRLDYPSFSLQIPAPTLGRFLALITDTKAYDLGKWLLYNEEVDGPLIPERLYTDPATAPALIAFATQTNDRALLSRLIELRAQANTDTGEGPTLRSSVTQSFFDTQVALRRFDAAERLLQHMMDSSTSSWNIVNLASLGRAMLALRQNEINDSSDSGKNLERAKRIFSRMVAERLNRNGEKRQYKADQVSVFLSMFSAVDSYWATYCLSLQALDGHYDFKLSVKPFNVLLEGVVEAYGSAAGRRLLGLFWSHAVRKAQTGTHGTSEGRVADSKVPRARQGPLDAANRQRTVIYLPGQQSKHVVIHGGLQPDLTTIRVIFRRAVEEMRAQRNSTTGAAGDVPVVEMAPLPFQEEPVTFKELEERTVDISPSGMVVWAVRCFRALGRAEEDIRQELSEALEEQELYGIQVQLPRLFSDAEREDTHNELRENEPRECST